MLKLLWNRTGKIATGQDYGNVARNSTPLRIHTYAYFETAGNFFPKVISKKVVLGPVSTLVLDVQI